jgi:hypothetical protein
VGAWGVMWASRLSLCHLLAAMHARSTICSSPGCFVGTAAHRQVVGDYKGHLSATDWERVDALWHERMGGVAAMQPLTQYMRSSN